MEGEGAAPILRHDDGVARAESIEEDVEIADVIGEAIFDVGLAGLAKADQVRCDAARDGCDVRDDVAPDGGRGRVSVQEQDNRAAGAGLDVRDGRAQDGCLAAGRLHRARCAHDEGLPNTVANTMDLKRSRGAGLRSTFMRSIAPCHPASRKSARSSAPKVVAMSPAAWPCAMQAANGARQRSNSLESFWRSRSLLAAVSRLKLPIRQPRAQAAPSSLAVMASR